MFKFFSCEISFVYLQMTIHLFFFTFFFFSYSYFFDICVVCIVSGRFNLSSSAHFYVDFESYRCIDAIFNADDFSSAFVSRYICMISLGSKALCAAMSFLVLWSICWSSFLVCSKNGPEYLTRGTAQAFIPLMRFLPYSLVYSCFLVLPRYSFFLFSFILLL